MPPCATSASPALRHVYAGKQLSKGRKKRPTPEGLASEADIGEYSEQGSATPHSSVKQGISCVDMHPADKTITLTGGLDKSAIVFNHTTNKVVAELKGHSKKLTSVKFHPDASRDVILTTSADKTAKIWSKSGKGYAESATITAHTAEVTGVSVHPTGAYAATVGMDAAWTFNSLETGACLKRVSDDKAPGGFTCVKFHPDGEWCWVCGPVAGLWVCGSVGCVWVRGLVACCWSLRPCECSNLVVGA